MPEGASERIRHAKRVYEEMKRVLLPKELADVVAVAGGVKKGGKLDLPVGPAFEFRSALMGLGLRVREHALGDARIRFLFTASPEVSDAFLDALHADSDFISDRLSDAKRTALKHGPDSKELKQAIDAVEQWKNKKHFEKRLAAFTGPSIHDVPKKLSAAEKKRIARQVYFIAQHFPALHNWLAGKAEPQQVSKHGN
ncbi:MAG: hypothetical protein AB1626_01730 [Candidatus Micrarchaeota archaeon]